MKPFLAISIVFLLPFTAYAQKIPPECQSLYDHLESLAKKNVVTTENISDALETTKKLVDLNCSIDEFPVTSTMGDLTIKSDNPEAVAYFIDYYRLMSGSAEEELGYSLYRIYGKYPEKVLEIASSFPDLSYTRERLKNDLGWRFQGHYEEFYKSGLPFKNYFFSKHPELKKLMPQYGPLIEQIIKASEFEE